MKELTKQSIDSYINDKVPPASFLKAVYENNLMMAVTKADLDNLRDLKEIVCYIYNEAPSVCWGSPAKVAAWLASR